MNINSFELNGVKKEKTGNSYSRYLRKNNLIPFNAYSSNLNLMGYLNYIDLQKALNSKTLFNQFTKLNLEGKTYLVYAKMLQKHPVTEKYLHIDFIIVEENQTIEMKVPIKFENQENCETIKLGAVLNIITPFVILKGLVKDMPNYLHYDLTNAGKESLLIKHISIPSNVSISKKFKITTIGTILKGRK